jgi:retinol dehydrogenase-12
MSDFISMISQTFPGQPTWTAKDMPDLSGKICIVTGGNAGVGYETVKVNFLLILLILSDI